MSPNSSSPYVVIGLGNPGDKYSDTLHNIGFLALDALESRFPGSRSAKFHAQICQTEIAGRKVLLVWPQTYMNLSGTAALEVVQFYKVDPTKDVVVVSDDADLPLGQLRLRPTGGTGGHNGLKSLVESFGGEGFARIRVGTGRPEVGAIEDFLLKRKFGGVDKTVLMDAVTRAANAVETSIKEGFSIAMNQFNQKGTSK